MQRTLSYPPIKLYLAAIYAASGHLSEARATIDRLLADEPSSTITYWTRPNITPYANADDREHFAKNLRLAGMPE